MLPDLHKGFSGGRSGGLVFPSLSEFYIVCCDPHIQEESEKVGLKLNIQKTKIMTSGPITSWQIDGETMEIVTEFIWGAPKSLQMVTAAMKLKATCSLEEKL